MGGSVSAGRNNDELIDHLVEAEFIRTPTIQRVFRSVDRGNYYCKDEKQNAYKDIAWRIGNFHLSAPCVYSSVMEALKLKAGLSFLNLGSGTGYLSTMAGLVLGPYGTNHGIELYGEVVDFAYDRLEDFLKNSEAVDEFEFCEPTFVKGNCLWLDSGCQQYDRVYCGASCPPEYDHYVKNLIKIGGILIMPTNEKLLKITRTSETTWCTARLLSVSFAPLVCPSIPAGVLHHIKLGDVGPPKLQQICRSTIRSLLRRNVEAEVPELVAKAKGRERQPRHLVRRIVIPFFDDTNSEDEDEEYDSDSPEFHLSSHLPTRMSVFLENFLRRHAEHQLLPDGDSDEDRPIPHVMGDADTVDDSDGGEFFSLFTLTNVRRPSSGEENDDDGDDDEPNDSPPSANTRSKRKRKRQAGTAASTSSNRPGTSSSSSTEPAVKVKRTSATVYYKARKKAAKRRRLAAAVRDPPSAESYMSCIVRKISELPLPLPLLRYLNYKRDNL